MEFSNKNFNADKGKQFEEIRKAMADIYSEQPSLLWTLKTCCW